MGLQDYPKLPCPNCRNNKWWYHQTNHGNSWLCMQCQSPVDPIDLLKARAILANRLLYLAWFEIYGRGAEVIINGKITFDPEMAAQYKEGEARAKKIAEELKAAGVKDCLYIENGKKLKICNVMPTRTSTPSWDGFFCHACPNDYWFIKELMEFDQNKPVTLPSKYRGHVIFQEGGWYRVNGIPGVPDFKGKSLHSACVHIDTLLDGKKEGTEMWKD